MNRSYTLGILAVALVPLVAPGSASAEPTGTPPVIVVDQNQLQPAQPQPQPQPGYGPSYGQPDPGYGQPQPGYGQPQPTYGQPDPSYGQPQPAYGTPQPVPLSAPRPRVRVGGAVLGGATLVGGDTAGSASGVGGAAGRIGVQINPRWGIYLNEQALIGGYLQVAPTGATRTIVFASVYTSVLGSAVFGDRFELAFGPSIDAVSAISVGTFSGGVYVGAFEGRAAGLHLRAALLLGSPDPLTGGRSGFALSLEAHPTFFGGFTLTTISVGLGADWY